MYVQIWLNILFSSWTFLASCYLLNCTSCKLNVWTINKERFKRCQHLKKLQSLILQAAVLFLMQQSCELGGGISGVLVLGKKVPFILFFFPIENAHPTEWTVQMMNNCMKTISGSLIKSQNVQACVHKNLTMTPMVHFGKKHPITELKILLGVPLTAGES